MWLCALTSVPRKVAFHKEPIVRHFSFNIASHARRACVVAAGVAALGLTGCVAYPVASAGDGVYVNTAPPAPIHEVVTVAPAIGMVWTPGFWAWTGVRYQWTAGRWAHPPEGRSQWQPGYWQHTPRGHVYVPGAWRAGSANGAAPSRVVPDNRGYNRDYRGAGERVGQRELGQQGQYMNGQGRALGHQAHVSGIGQGQGQDRVQGG